MSEHEMYTLGFNDGRKYGYDEGCREAWIVILQMQLGERFGSLSLPVNDRLKSLYNKRLVELALDLLKAQSLQELGLVE